MAIRYAVTGGTWSSTSTWNDGATLGIPTSVDDVYTNSFTVTINQNVTANTLNNTSSPIIVSNIATPAMTNNTSPSGIANASSNATNAWFCFNQDNSYTTLWTIAATSGWVSYQFPTGKIIKRYVIKGGTSGINQPSGWQFQGSNDGSSWTTLETVTGYAMSAGGNYTSPVLANSTSYTYYRVNITASTGGSTSMSEIEMTESTSTVVGGTGGGTFTFSTGSTTTVASSLGLVGTSFLFISNGGTQNITFTSATNNNRFLNITSTNSNTTVTGQIPTSDTTIFFTAAGTLTLNGNISTTAGANSAILTSFAGATITVNGNVNGGSTTARGIILPSGAGNLTIIGNVTGGGGTGGSAILSQGTATINITGNLVGGGGGNAIQLQAAPSVINVTGNVTGGTLSAIGGVFSYPINVTGTITGGNNASGIDHSGTITVNGNVFASSTGNGINSSGTVNLNGNMFNVNGKMAIYAPIVWLDQTGTTQSRFFTSGGADRTLYSDNTFPNQPSVSNVRFSTQFGPSSGLTGTLRMASPSDVRSGVATDNTVGTALFDTSQLLAELNASSDPIAQRLRKVATPEILGQLLAAYKK